MLILLIFTFRTVAKIYIEIRDYAKDRNARRNFVVMAGRQQAFAVTLGAMTLAFVGTALFAGMQPEFRWLLLFVPFGIFLIHPVRQTMRDRQFEPTFVHTLNTRAILLAFAIIGVFAILRWSGSALL